MGRYLSLPILGLAAALSATVIPRMIGFAVSVLGNLTPALENTHGQVSLVLLLVITWSIRASLTDSFVWAFVGGMAIDLLSVLPLGASSLALVLIAFAVNTIAQQLYQVSLISILIMTALSTLFFQFFTYQSLVLLGNAYHLPSLIQLVLMPTILYNLAAVLPVYGFVRLMQSRLEGRPQAAPMTLPQEPGAGAAL